MKPNLLDIWTVASSAAARRRFETWIEDRELMKITIKQQGVCEYQDRGTFIRVKLDVWGLKPKLPVHRGWMQQWSRRILE